MHNSNIPSQMELPSTGRLVRSTLVAAAVAGVLLVTVVMPAEYGIDPTGLGSITGLQNMGEIKKSLAAEAAPDSNENTAETAAAQLQAQMEAPLPEGSLRHERVLSLAPNQAVEIKLRMTKGRKVRYSWETDGAALNFDLHADSQKLRINYHPYSKGRNTDIAGELVAAFDGYHGWFWRNRTDTTITVTLRTEGEYLEIKRVL